MEPKVKLNRAVFRKQCTRQFIGQTPPFTPHFTATRAIHIKWVQY